MADLSRATVRDGADPYEPEWDDLFYLYRATRDSCAVSILEFGSGWSTLAFALALDENRRAFGDIYTCRHPNQFLIQTIDASESWLEITIARIPPHLREIVVPVHSTPYIGEFNGQVVSFYRNIPPFSPDIVYLDGPNPEQVDGSIDGFGFAPLHGLPMAADLLRLESHLWPYTQIIVDGRTANARFLRANFVRSWHSVHDPFGDRTVFVLEEPPLGELNEEHLRIRLATCRDIRSKDRPLA